jgi:hypothetical protein
MCWCETWRVEIARHTTPPLSCVKVSGTFGESCRGTNPNKERTRVPKKRLRACCDSDELFGDNTNACFSLVLDNAIARLVLIFLWFCLVSKVSRALINDVLKVCHFVVFFFLSLIESIVFLKNNLILKSIYLSTHTYNLILQ